MAQVSKTKISDKVWEKVWKGYVEVLSRQGSRSAIDTLMQGLLTQTERSMLAKRLTACVLLLSNWPVTEISRQLKMGTATIYKYQALLEKDTTYRMLLIGSISKIKQYSKKDDKEPNFLLELLENMWVGRTKRSRLIHGKM